MFADSMWPMIIIFIVTNGLFVAATLLSRAGRLSPALKPIVGKAVDVRVWGTPIGDFRLHAVRAFGAGLLLQLEPRSGGKPTLLKVAQPQSASHDERGIVISEARYVQWRGARIPRVEGFAALELTVVAESENPV